MLLPVFILKPVLLFYSKPSIFLWKNLASFLKEKVCCPKANTKKKLVNLYSILGLEVENNQRISWRKGKLLSLIGVISFLMALINWFSCGPFIVMEGGRKPLGNERNLLRKKMRHQFPLLILKVKKVVIYEFQIGIAQIISNNNVYRYN